MTPKPATASYKKPPVSKSKSWKESIRKACLERVRKGTITSSPRDVLNELIAVTPCRLDYNNNNEQVDHMMVGDDPIAVDHFLSEEDLLELLVEMEDEMAKMDDQRLQEAINTQQDENDYFEQQVLDFESETPDDSVLCPICQQEWLLSSTDNVILCPSVMDDSCSFRTSQFESMSDLRRALGRTLEHHTITCEGQLLFRCDQSFVNATCALCEPHLLTGS